MKVSVEGTYYIVSRKIKEVINFDMSVEVPNGLEEHKVLELLTDHEKSPIVKKLKQDDKQFSRLRNVKLTSFSFVPGDDEEMDTPESLGLETNIEKKPSGKVTANSEFGNITEALSDKPKKGK